MWNISESDKKHLEREAQEDKKRNKTLSKAKARGKVAEKWLKTNRLNKETQAEFNRLMKETDKEYERNTIQSKENR